MANSIPRRHAVSPFRVDCGDCSLRSLCLPRSLSLAQIAELNKIVRPLAALPRNEVLCRQGTPFTSLFAVRTGSFRQVSVTRAGEQVITAIFLPGELVGLDAIAEGLYQGTVESLELSTACELPFEQVDKLCAHAPELRRQLHLNLSQEVLSERLNLRLLLCRTAEIRVALFLVGISERFQRQGYSPFHYRLALSRGDIGSYLGLTEETVGRSLLRLQALELLAIQGRDFHLLDLPRLMQLAETRGRRSRRR